MDKLYYLYNELLKVKSDSKKYFEIYLEYVTCLAKINGIPLNKGDVNKFKNGNCYSYALNLYNPENISNDIIQLGTNIGFFSQNNLYKTPFEKYLYYLKKDLEKLDIDFYDTFLDSNNIYGGYKILFYLSNNDFHFIRENEDNTYSSKIGYKNEIDYFYKVNEFYKDYKFVKALEIVKKSK